MGLRKSNLRRGFSLRLVIVVLIILILGLLYIQYKKESAVSSISVPGNTNIPLNKSIVKTNVSFISYVFNKITQPVGELLFSPRGKKGGGNFICVDSDKDGWNSTSKCDYNGIADCNDNNSAIYPGATEIPYDGIDQNCDGYDLADVDNDGYCKAGYVIQNKTLQCSREIGAIGTDCNDNNLGVNPGATEICGDNIDNNCNGLIDEGCTSVCGNGIIESGELCDSNSISCTINGYSGTQSCNLQCNGWNSCVTTQRCGDGIINGNEICDGITLNGQTCVTQGFSSGTLSCNSLCNAYDTSLCVSNSPFTGGAICDPNTYYIDYVNGNNINNGTCSNSAWKVSPGMVGFTGSYIHKAGDKFVFKGGVIWPSSTLPLTISYSGSSTASDQYTIDSRWYSGSSFSQPVFDDSGNGVSLIIASGKSYFVVNDLKMINSGTAQVSNSFHGLDIQNSQQFTLSNNTLAPESWLGFYVYTSSSGNYNNINIINNNISNTDMGVVIATAAANSIINNVNISNNMFHDFSSQLGGGTHGDGIHTWGSTTDNSQYIQNMIINNNLFYGNFTRSFGTSGAMTAFIYVSDATQGALIYNNVGSFSTGQNPGENLFESMISLRGNTGRGGYHKIYNNVFRSNGGNDMSTAILLADGTANAVPYTEIKNNILSGMRYGILVSSGSEVGLVSNYNDLSVTNSAAYYLGVFKTFSQWQALGYDLNGINSDPLFVNTITYPFDLHLQSTSACIDKGTSLSSYFSTDKDGVTRPQGLAWDIGAYER